MNLAPETIKPRSDRLAFEDGSEIRWQSAGSGIAVVVPRSTEDEEASDPGFLRALMAGYETVVYQQRQPDRTSEDGGASAAADLWAVANETGLERAVLYGSGGTIETVVNAACQYPDRVLGLILDTTSMETSSGGDRRAGVATLEFLSTLPQELLDRSLLLCDHHGWTSNLLPASLRTISVRRGGERLGAIHAFLAGIDVEQGRYASRLAPALSGAAHDTERSITSLRHILVPVADAQISERAAAMACRLGDPRQTELLLLHVVEIPLVRPLTSMTDLERERGEQALRVGQTIAAGHGVRSRVLLRAGRLVSRGILLTAQEARADLIVMTVGEASPRESAATGRTIREVLRFAPCEVLIDQAKEPVR